MLTFGQMIRSARHAKQWSLRRVVFEMDIKIPASYLSAMEVRGKIPRGRVCLALAKALGLDYAVLAARAIHELSIRDLEKNSAHYWSVDQEGRPE